MFVCVLTGNDYTMKLSVCVCVCGTGNDYTMKLSRGTLYAQSKDTRCTPFKYRYPNEIQVPAPPSSSSLPQLIYRIRKPCYASQHGAFSYCPRRKGQFAP